MSNCALFNFMGSGIKSDPLAANLAEWQVCIERMGGAGEDSYRAERTYTELAAMWGVAEP